MHTIYCCSIVEEAIDTDGERGARIGLRGAGLAARTRIMSCKRNRDCNVFVAEPVRDKGSVPEKRLR